MNSEKIIHVITGLETGGAEKALYRLLKSCPVEKRNQFRVVSLNGKGTIGPKLEALNIPVIDLSIINIRKSVAGFRRLLRYCSAEQPVILQGWMYHANLAVTLVSPWIKSRPRTIWGIRGSLHDKRSFKWATRVVIGMGKLLSGRPDVIIFNSKTGARQHQKSGYCMKHAHIIPNGFDGFQFSHSVDEKKYARAELGIDPAALVVGTVGRYHYAKGSDLFLQMVNVISIAIPGVQFVCVGRGMDQKNSNISSSSGAQGVHFLGERDDVRRMLSMMDVFVSTSRTEGFPNALAEAMLSGLPCVATDVGDSRLILADGGTIVAPGNVAALSEAVLGFLQLSKSERLSIGQLGRTAVLKNYSQDCCTQAYLDLYDHIFIKSEKRH